MDVSKGLLLLLACVLLFSCEKEDYILFKDSFEKYEVGKVPNTPWKKTGDGTAVIDKNRAFSGTQSVHFTTGPGYQNRSFIGIDHIFPLEGNEYYGSLHMYVEEASPDGVHWTMIQSSGDVKGADFSSEIRYGGQHDKKLMANYDTQGVKSDCWQHSQVQIPEKKWFKLQWYFNGNEDAMQLWLDTTLIESISIQEEGEGCVENGTDGKWKFPVFENILIGWVDYQTGGGNRNVWIDDIVISTKPYTP